MLDLETYNKFFFFVSQGKKKKQKLKRKSLCLPSHDYRIVRVQKTRFREVGFYPNKTIKTKNGLDFWIFLIQIVVAGRLVEAGGYRRITKLQMELAYASKHKVHYFE